MQRIRGLDRGRRLAAAKPLRDQPEGKEEDAGLRCEQIHRLLVSVIPVSYLDRLLCQIYHKGLWM